MVSSPTNYGFPDGFDIDGLLLDFSISSMLVMEILH